MEKIFHELGAPQFFIGKFIKRKNILYMFTSSIKEFLLKHVKEIDFFQSVRLLEIGLKNNLTRKIRKNSIVFKISNSEHFTWSIIEFLSMINDNINVYINISALLTIKHAKLFKKAASKESFIHYFINRFIWLYYKAFNKSNLELSMFNKKLNRMDAMCYHYSGALTHSRFSIEALQTILIDYFKIPLTIDIYFGKWIQLPYCYRKAHLNKIFLGSRIFLICRQIIIVIGPLADNYLTFLPGGGNFKQLIEFLKIYLPTKWSIIIKSKIYSHAVMNCRLFSDDKKNSYYLGWTICLYSIRHKYICSMPYPSSL